MKIKNIAILAELLLFVSTTIINCTVAHAAPLPHDPTRPFTNTSGAVYTDSQRDDFWGINIGSIIVAKDRKIVSINGQYLQVGDRIGELTIVDIGSDSIRVRNLSGEFIIKTSSPDIKTPVNKIKGK